MIERGKKERGTLKDKGMGKENEQERGRYR